LQSGIKTKATEAPSAGVVPYFDAGAKVITGMVMAIRRARIIGSNAALESR